MAKKLQLKPVHQNLPYADAMENIKFNLAVLLDAYVHGANAMIFEGEPGLDGNIGPRGASLLAVTFENFRNAYSVINQDADFNAIYETRDLLINAINEILANPNAFELLFVENSVVSTVDDLVDGDLFLFDNGKLLSAWYDSELDLWTVTGDFPVDILTTVTGMTRTEIMNLINSITTEATALFTRTESILAKSRNSEEQYFIPNLSYKDESEHPTVDMSTLVASCLWTYLKSAQVSSERHVFVVGSADFANEVFGKLSLYIDDDMYRSTETPTMFVLQPKSSGKGDENTKFGIAILDGNDIQGEQNPEDWKPDNKLMFERFGHITKDGDKLWFSSHSARRKNDTDDSWKFGRMYVSKDMIEAWANNMTIHIATHAILEAPWVSINALHYLEVEAANIYIRNQKNWLAVGTDENGMLIDSSQLILDWLSSTISNDVLLGEIHNRKRKQKFDAFQKLKNMQSMSVESAKATDTLKQVRDALGLAKLAGTVLNRFLYDSNAFFVLDPLKYGSKFRNPGLYVQRSSIDSQLPAIFNRMLNTASLHPIELADVVTCGNSAVTYGFTSNAGKTFTSAYFFENIFPSDNSDNENDKQYVTEYRRILDFNGMSSILAISANQLGYVALVDVANSMCGLLFSRTGKPNTWSMLPNSLMSRVNIDGLPDNDVLPRCLSMINDKILIFCNKSIRLYSLETNSYTRIRTDYELGIPADSVIRSFATNVNDILVHSFSKGQHSISRIDFEENALVRVGATDTNLYEIIAIPEYADNLCYGIASTETNRLQLIAFEETDLTILSTVIAALPGFITDVYVSGMMHFATLVQKTGLYVDNAENDFISEEYQAKLLSTAPVISIVQNPTDILIDTSLDPEIVIPEEELYAYFSTDALSVSANGGTVNFEVLSNTEWEIMYNATIDVPDPEEPQDPYAYFSKNRLQIPVDGGDIDFNVLSNTEWTIYYDGEITPTEPPQDLIDLSVDSITLGHNEGSLATVDVITDESWIIS